MGLEERVFREVRINKRDRWRTNFTTRADFWFAFTVAAFGFTDSADSPANNLLNVKIRALPAAGQEPGHDPRPEPRSG